MTHEMPHVWRRFGYKAVPVPTKDGRLRQVSKPAISICARHGSHAQSDTSKIKIQANGLLDTGADMSVVPLWLLWQLGIAVNEESRLTAACQDSSLHTARRLA